MSTRSSISIAKEDGTIQQIYAHWDGYISHNGVILFNYYQEPEKVKELMKLGDLSSLAPEITPKGSHSYDNPESGVTVFYGRDRGEDNISAKTFYSADKFMSEGNFQSVDYLYREKTKKWYVIDQDTNKFKELKGLIKKELKSLPAKYKSDFLALVEQQKEEKKLKTNEVSLTSKPKF